MCYFFEWGYIVEAEKRRGVLLHMAQGEKRRKMTNDSFKNRVIRKLEMQGYRVHPIWDDNQRCPFDLISVNPKGKGAGVKLKAHGHISKEEKEELLWYDMPMYVASEKWEGGSSEVHGIKVERLE